MPKSRLTRTDWIDAGFNALASDGYAALKAETLARALNATKGSFYWHFKDLADYRRQVLETWRRQATEVVIDALTDLPAGAETLDALVARAVAPDRSPAIDAAERAIREWARHDPDAAAALRAIDERRVAFLTEQFDRLGRSGRARAEALYAAYLGFNAMAAGVGRERRAALELLGDALIRAARSA